MSYKYSVNVVLIISSLKYKQLTTIILKKTSNVVHNVKWRKLHKVCEEEAFRGVT